MFDFFCTDLISDISLASFVLPYSSKIWRGFEFGDQLLNRQIKWQLPLHPNSLSTSFADCARALSCTQQLRCSRATGERSYWRKSSIYDGTLQQESQTNFTLHYTLEKSHAALKASEARWNKCSPTPQPTK